MKRAVLCSIILSACGGNGLTHVTGRALVSGSICDPTTKIYVAGATVVLTEYDVHDVPLTEKTTTTDDAGHFSVGPVDSGDAKIHVTKGNFVYDTEVTVKNANIALPDPGCQLPTGSITGQVCNAGAGAWLQGATVSVATPNGTITATNPTDVLGHFTLTGVAAGKRTVVAAGGGVQLSFDVTVPADGSVDLGYTESTEPGLTNIDGQICAKTPGNWLTGATVVVSAAGVNSTATTDQNGQFDLHGVPPGSYTGTATKGAFSATFTAVTAANKTTVIDPACSTPDVPIAVVSGAYDSVQKSLVALGFDVHHIDVFEGADDASDVTDLPIKFSLPWAPKLLTGVNPAIYNYKIVFFDSGLSLDQDGDGTPELGAIGSAGRNQMLSVLQQYVNSGGFVYASDHAYELLLGMSPDIVFHGDATLSAAANVGIKQEIKTVSVADPGLASALGVTTLDVNFLLPNFTVADSASNGAKIYLQSDVLIAPDAAPVTVPQSPLLVSFPVGSGRAIFTSVFSSPEGPWSDITTVNAVTAYLVFEL